MKVFIARRKKVLLFSLIIVLLVGLAWAVLEVAGRINAMCQTTGSHSAELEMLSLATIRKPVTGGSCDWATESSIRRSLESLNAAYSELIKKAEAEVAEYHSPRWDTYLELNRMAVQFRDLCEKYGDFWDACGFPQRAMLARAVGDARLMSSAFVQVKVSIIAHQRKEIFKYAKEMQELVSSQ